MDKLKKEWKSILIVIWLVGITLVLYNMRTNMFQLQTQNHKVADTLDAVEGVIIGVDAGVHDSNKRLEGLESQINYIVKKVRRR